METGLMEQLVQEDFGLEIQGTRWARAKEHDSLIIDREKQIFYWNSEGIVGDPFIYLVKVRKLNSSAAKDYLLHTGFSGTFIHRIEEGTETIVYPRLVDVFHENLLDQDRTYFYNRTITDETISRFKLGFYNGFYTIPIYQDGTFRQFQMRRDSPKLIRNYYRGVGPLLFNSDLLKLTSKIYLTEGLMSAIVLNQNGMPAVAMNIGADGFMVDWIKYFINQKEIVILFDHDAAGDFGAIRTANILGRYRCQIYNFWDWDAKGFAADDFMIEGGTAEKLQQAIKVNSKLVFEMEKKRG